MSTRVNAHDRQSVLARDDSWRHHAACRDTDPNLWFPVGATGDAQVQADAAKQVCAQCPVREPCLEYAIVTNQEGIWGGTNEGERVQVRTGRRRRAAEARA